MPHQHNLWAWYISAALIVLLCKLIRYVFIGIYQDVPILKSIKTWFFEGTRDNVASWAATVGIVWLLGYCYIKQVTWFFGDLFNMAPLEPPFAFVFGCVAEIAAPNFVKWLVSKIPGNT